ncbi:MAG: LacI family DNA-binding transcriptional regulator [Oscillospiraceae bacterium]|nr:LacI family DNA-binding transcriptional regulator [Oscillospiraceae bacterium]
MKVKITDVALASGVSIATVSHVINHTRYVSPETTRKVEQAIEALGYSPDLTARNFKRGRKGFVGMLVPDLSYSRSSLILKQLEEVLAPSRIHLIVSNTKGSVPQETEQVKLLASGLVDGLVVQSSCVDYQQIAPCIPRDFPMVFIDHPLKNCPYPTLVVSSYTALYQGVEDLIRQGHTQIGYIADQAHIAYSIERLDAYRAAVRDYALPIGDSLIAYAHPKAKAAYLCTRDLIERKCTAIVVSNNAIALETLKYLNVHHLQVGDDVELLGFSGSDWYGYRTEQIAQVSQPTEEMARMAGQQLLEWIEAPSANARTTVLHSTYIPKKQEREFYDV